MLKSLLVLVAVNLIIPMAEARSKARIYYRHVVELSAAPITAAPKEEPPSDPEIQQANNAHKKRTSTVDEEILDLGN